MSECKHGYYCKDGTPCVLCHEDELAALRAKLKEAEGIVQKFAEAARDACIAGLAQSSKMRQYEDRIAELESEVARLREALDGLREAYRIMRNAAAGYSQHCEGFTTKLDKDFRRAEDIARAAMEGK